MNNLRSQLLAITILSVLLVNLERCNAHSIQDSLPALVLDDEHPSVSSSSPAAPKSAAKLDEDNKESKVISYETSKREEEQTTSAERAKESTVEPAKETTSQASSAPESTTTAKPALEEPATSRALEKDISVLLANKNDAENDLASPSSTDAPTMYANSKPSVVVTSTTSEEKKQSDLGAPVDTNKQNDDRLHYAFGSPEQKVVIEEQNKFSDKKEASAEVAPEKPLEGKREVEAEKKPTEQKPEDAKPDVAASPELKGEEKLDGKKEMLDDKSKSDESPKRPEAEVESDTKQSPTTEAPSPSSPTTLAPSSSEVPLSTTSESPKEEPKKVELPVAKGEKPEVEESTKKVSNESSTSAAPKKTTTTTTTSTAATSAKPSERPSVPSILAVALGTALGAAVNPILNKSDKPAASPPLTTSATTKAPPSTSKKSATDRWDHWTPSPPSTSSSTSVPARRRPILPSIRRRFRPYNRFSPFPWGGADAYSPAGGEPEFMSTDPPYSMVPRRTSSTTYRPKRRGSSSTELPSSRSPSSVSPASSDDEDEEVPVRPESSDRRRGSGNKRRHQHNHNRGESGEPSSRRRHPHHSHRHHDREERPVEASPFDSPFAPARPISPGFNLFNTETTRTGSGFDLLNPFSDWLDDFEDKPKRPPARSPSSFSPSSSSSSGRPSVHRPTFGSEGSEFEGDYGRHDHHYHGRPHNGRDEFDSHEHNHHHCHEHDHDHHHHREPYRPHREREPLRPPIGGYDDSYTPPGGYGRRPARPYNRRDQAEQERNNRENESSDASPGLYGGRIGAVAPVAPRRVPSIFSPFDSLFGSLDDGLFGLRSSFIDAPLRAASEAVHTFDTVVSSPKILKQGVEQAPSLNKEPSNLSALDKPKDVKPLVPADEHITNDSIVRGTRAFG